MTKNEVLSAIAEETATTKGQIEAVLDSFERIILDKVFHDNDRINLGGLGTFKKSVKKGRAARLGRNPATGQSIQIPATQDKNIIKFLPSPLYR